MLKAKDGLKQAHMDVLVAVPGKTSPTTDTTESSGTGNQTPGPEKN